MPRHAAGHRVDGVLDVDALASSSSASSRHGVLGLGHGEAVAGHDDHVWRVGQLDRRVVGATSRTEPPGRRRRPAACPRRRRSRRS